MSDCKRRCGKCCDDILPITPRDRKRISEYIKKNGISASNMMPDKCPFLRYDMETKRTECAIYEVRPCICKIYSCSQSQRRSNEAFKEYATPGTDIYSMRSTFL